MEDALPGRQGRLLFAYLVAHRRRPSIRSELAEALWPNQLPAAVDNALSALLTKLRSVSGIDFADHGSHTLRGVPGDWRVFAVRAESVAQPIRPLG